MKELFFRSIVIICLPLLVKGKDVFDKCSYLVIDENQSNGYFTDEGHPCCLCGKGTRWAGDCSSTEKMYETRCEPCVYNDEIKTFVDFEPHKRTICEVEQFCSAGFVSVGGSASEKSRCECPNGSKKKDEFNCEDVIAETTTPTTITDEIDMAVDVNVVVPLTATIENRLKNVSPKVNLTHVPSNTTIYISNEDENQPDKFTTTMHVIIVIGTFFILALILCGVRKKIRTYFLKRVKSCASEPGDVVTHDPQRLSSQHDTSLTAHLQSEEANHFVDTVVPNEVQSLLSQSANTGPDDPSDHNFYLSEEVEIVFVDIDDVEAGRQQGVAQEDDSGTLSSVVVVETPESYSELEMQNNKAGPIDSGNQNGVVRESSEVSSDYLGNTVHASNQQQLGTDFALQGSSLTQQADPRISLDHKKFRQIAMENIAAIINQKDRMLLSHFLIPKDADLDSINESHRGDGHAEIFRRVFIRGFQLNPNLSLYELRDKAVEWKLGYLKDEFEDQIKQLERRIAQ